MKIKRLAVLITAFILSLIFSINCFALLGNQDPYSDGGISFADTQNEAATAITRPSVENEVRYEHGISEKNAKIINTLINYWNNYGMLTIVIVLVLVVIIAIFVSVSEKNKLRELEKKIKSESENQ